MRSDAPDITYLSTSDYVQHAYAPGAKEANRFYSVIDRCLEDLDELGLTLVVTADHGMRSKTDSQGRPRVLFLQSLLDAEFGQGICTVILPITDPYIAHHGSLGSFATIYLQSQANSRRIVRYLSSLSAIDLVLLREAACHRFELPEDRIGDLVVFADGDSVLGTHPKDHDLSQLRGPLRSHGGLAEREVPMFFNWAPAPTHSFARLNNYDAFWLGLNCASGRC